MSSEIELPEDNSMICFSIVIISKDVAVVDCVNNHGSTRRQWENHYYIVTSDPDIPIVSEKINNCYLLIQPFGRKTIKYETTHNGFT